MLSEVKFPFFGAKKEKFLAAAFIITAVAFILILYIFNPHYYDVFIPCYFQYITGYECAGCGGIRGFYHLLHGNFFEAIKSNYLLIFAFPIFIYLLVYNFLILFN